MALSFKDLTELGRMVDEEQVVPVTLGDLRKAEPLGFDRLGKYVLDQIASALEGEGLGYFPVEAIENNSEPRQWQEVRVYRRGTGIGKLIQAVTNPSPSGDKVLREASTQDSDLIKQIRALVCP